MRLQWKGRSYRPAANLVKVTKPSVNELIKPLSMKSGLGSAVLTGEFISGIGDAYGPDVPVVTPTASVTPTITQTSTPTQTSSPTPSFTPTLTPTSTPFPIVQPSLWFDASDDSTLFKVLSGGTTYVSQITSKGTETWTLTAATSDRWCIYSASTFLPGSPGIMRFTPNATITTLRQGYSAYGRTPILHSGATIFQVVAGALPSFQITVYSGSTSGGVILSGSSPFDRLNYSIAPLNIVSQISYPQSSNSTASIPAPISAASLNDKYLVKVVNPHPTGFATWELNQSGGTTPVNFTGTTVTPQWNAAFLGGLTTSAGTQTYNNGNVEFCELMIYNRILTSAEQEAVELYLRDKWRYDEWASPVPTPTQTPSQTQTSTPTVTPSVTTTSTVTPTPSSTPPPFSPSGVTNLQHWYMSNSGATVSSWTNYGLLGGSATQSVAANQAQIISNGTLGSYTGQTVQFDSARDFYSANTSSLSTSAHTSYLVYKPIQSAPAGWALGLRTTTNYAWYYQNYFNANSGITASNVGSYITNRNTAAQLIVSSGNSSSITATRNDVLGISSATIASSATTSNMLELGYDAGITNTQTIQVFEWIFYNKELSSSEHANVISYLKTKYQYGTW